MCELEDIDLIRNDVNAFLTCYTDYVANRKDKFTDEIKNIWFHKALVVGYEENGNDIVLKIIEDNDSGILYVITLNNVLVNQDIVDEKTYNLINVNFHNDDTWVEIQHADYGNYEDYNYYLKLFLSNVPGIMKVNNKSDVVVTFIADKITVETIF